MPCTCVEGQFERTTNMFFGRMTTPFVQELLRVKPGTVLAAPPVHDCAYIRLRNALSGEAWREALRQTRGIPDSQRELAFQNCYQTVLTRLLAERSTR